MHDKMAVERPKKRSRLAESAFNSPYSHIGASTKHPNTNPYIESRAQALLTLESLGYIPETMVERGVLWDDQVASLR